jgi:hypothetical protein
MVSREVGVNRKFNLERGDLLMKAIRLLLVSFLVVCVSTTNVVASEKSDKNSVIDQTYPQAQAEVIATFLAIRQNIMDGAGRGATSDYMNQLISFHAYGDKFVEFNGGWSFNSAENEAGERQLFGEALVEDGVTKFWFIEGTLNVAVYYGNVANLTFISDFDLIFEGPGPESERTHTVNNLITLLFVKTKGEWKMVHEHHSPVNEGWTRPPE